jgi:hypothetical protein
LSYIGAIVELMNQDSTQDPTNDFDFLAGSWNIHHRRLKQRHVGSSEWDDEFFGDDTDQGLPIKVRYRWRRQGTDKAHWDQAFSWDGGETWETNWTMAFNRAAWQGRP